MKKPKRVGEPSPIRDVLPEILRGFKGAASGPVERVRGAWVQVVGPSVAGRTRVASVANGRVSVEVASAALKHDLVAFRGADVLRGLTERLPDLLIREVTYRVGSLR